MGLARLRSFQTAAFRFAALWAFLALMMSAPARLRAEEPLLLLDVPVAGDSEAAHLSALGFDVAGVNRRDGTVGIVGTQADLAKLKALGYAAVLKEAGHPLRARGEALSDYTDPAELSAFMDQMVAAYPNLAKKLVLKDTLFEGQQQMALKITADVNTPHDRPVFMLDAQHHAREVMTAEIAKDAISYLLTNYGTDAHVTAWLDGIEIYVVASVNPDGSMYVFTTDNMWRKNRHPDCAVDINRNYGWSWASCGGSDDFCASETYHGTAPNSEPETQGMESLADAVRPLFSLSYHSYGEYLLYPYGCGDPSQMDVYDPMAQGLNSILENDQGATGRFKTGPSWDTIYVTDGSSDDEIYGHYGAFAFVIEVNCCSFQPDYAQWRDATVARQRTAWQYFLDETLQAPSVQGLVTDSATGEPLGANLVLAELTLDHGEIQRRASAAGRYGLVVKGGQTYHATFSLPGYVTQTVALPVGTGPARLDVQLVPVGAASTPHSPHPSDGGFNLGLNQVLTWQSDGATSYEVYFGTTPTPPLVATVTQPSYTLPSLAIGGRYYWQVVAVGPWGRTSGPIWSFTTHFYAVTEVRKQSAPFRLIVDGENFQPGCTVTIDGTPAPLTFFKSTVRLLAKGSGLKTLVPKGQSVQIVVTDSQGRSSEPFAFSW